MNSEEVIEKYGVNPSEVGNRFRSWWIVEVIEEEEALGNAQIGDLCVRTRDGGSNPIDPEAFRMGNCVGSSEDGFYCTYRNYYYRPIKENS